MTPTTPRPATRVVDVIAERTGVDPGDLTPPLSTVVDPDALNAIVDHADTADGVAVRFEYGDDEVVVRGDGRVEIQ
ncbi:MULTISPECIES: HalOD1 output domain-containing protein [Halolamina]|uniref:Halobacterial output domain-containing protein n=1 Tax=Halolamina pelagica TaxID=699431 RepID=A0A1I5TLB6_9EURY|nr:MULTISPECIES: HalOD1 output domain-containing protein [Halolamina]NHX37723.1 hypothetical protein [Halolamina sp. R1-12]SFP83864.1 hypothetical protein SAMN05216277_1102 [Halolamina pelagica]